MLPGAVFWLGQVYVVRRASIRWCVAAFPVFPCSRFPCAFSRRSSLPVPVHLDVHIRVRRMKTEGKITSTACLGSFPASVKPTSSARVHSLVRRVVGLPPLPFPRLPVSPVFLLSLQPFLGASARRALYVRVRQNEKL